ncbi:SPOC like C-terminal domain-containing protein [Phascolomyces articulosus]|uniref:ATP-dependent DNA helicase II subunit 1 n=1 Tax=Phascolomyces articulosus TaxID=60185 RepID=A0AAD5PAI4_9FUNG|nr:SPOC like C-terminal domain-containing protein [Phascolomyces articulosus]
MSSSFQSQLEDDPTFADDFATLLGGHDRILFLIDCGPSMQTPQENGEIPVKVAFDCVKSVMLNKVFSNDVDEVGVILFGTASQNNAPSHEHIYVLQDLDVPSAQKIKDAEAFGSAGQRDLKSEFGVATEEFPLGNVFWTCMEIFSEKAKKSGTRRVFMITDQDHPHTTNENLRNAAIQRAKDLGEIGVDIELFGLNTGGNLFDESLFYNEILNASKDDSEESIGREVRAPKGGSNNLDELLERVRRKRPMKRSGFRIPLRLADGLEIGVRGYNLIREQQRGNHTLVFTAAEQLQEVESKTTYKCADTEQTLMPDEIKSYWPVAGGQSVFNKDERQKLNSTTDPSLKLIGFFNQTMLRFYRSMSNPYFIYPDEAKYEGSTRAFTALLDAMLEQKQVGLCVFTARSNSTTLIVAMVPQKETLNENGIQTQPPGFCLIRLPYADDIRDMPPAVTERASDEQVEAAGQVLDKLYLDKMYDPADYENPSLQLHYAVLQSLALDQETVETVPDDTLPKFEVINDRLKNCVPHLESLLAEGIEVEPFNNSRKRKESANGDAESSQKRIRRPLSGSKSIEECYRDETLDLCTVPMLKEWVKSKGTYPKARKTDLIVQVCNILDKGP